ncbi:MAG TPA: cytochrome c [Candidatus Cybelea sp.]|nr:cytochrome c [Candidatus Cybelea sp.]
MGVFCCLLACALAACTTASYGGNGVDAGTAATQGGDRKAGERLFAANCASCHGAGGAGGIAPSLRGESLRMNYATLVSWIEDPEPPMPKLYPSPLSERQVRNVAAYVLTL